VARRDGFGAGFFLLERVAAARAAVLRFAAEDVLAFAADFAVRRVVPAEVRAFVLLRLLVDDRFAVFFRAAVRFATVESSLSATDFRMIVAFRQQ
jgi:hypothetical protein